jgi:peroxiredoxin
LDLSLTNEEGRSLDLSALRGRPSVLFLFATYDAPSQVALMPLLAASKAEDRATFVGIAVQPDAQAFLAPFRKALDIPFALYFDGTGALLKGTTALGKIPGIPAFVALDAEGHVCKTFIGVPSKADLESVIASAL